MQTKKSMITKETEHNCDSCFQQLRIHCQNQKLYLSMLFNGHGLT